MTTFWPFPVSCITPAHSASRCKYCQRCYQSCCAFEDVIVHHSACLPIITAFFPFICKAVPNHADRCRVKEGIFASVGIFATMSCAIYVNMRILCMFFFNSADLPLPLLWYFIDFHRIFFVTKSKVL